MARFDKKVTNLATTVWKLTLNIKLLPNKLAAAAGTSPIAFTAVVIAFNRWADSTTAVDCADGASLKSFLKIEISKKIPKENSGENNRVQGHVTYASCFRLLDPFLITSPSVLPS